MANIKIDLIALDVDGTLLRDDHTLSQATKEVLYEYSRLGTKIALATGRGPTSCFRLIEELELETPLITHNGAVLFNPVNQEVVYQTGYLAHELSAIFTYCRERKLQFDLSTALDMYVEQILPGTEETYKLFQVDPIVVERCDSIEEQIVKFTILSDSSTLDQVYQELRLLFPKYNIIRSGETFIDIIHPRATKGKGLLHLLDILNLKADHVIAFGNYDNDLEMLQYARLGVAMANSPEHVIAQADDVAPSNNEDGVAFYLQKLLNYK